MRCRVAKYQKPELIRLGDVEVGRVVNFSAISDIESIRHAITYVVLGKIDGSNKSVLCYQDTDDSLFVADEDRVVLALNLYAEQDGDADKIVINIDKKALDDAMLNAYDEDDEEDLDDDFFLATGLDTKIVDLADHITDIVKDEEEGRAFSMIGATFQTILEAIANAHVNGRVYEETKESSEYAIKLAETLAHIMSKNEPEFNDGEEADNE